MKKLKVLLTLTILTLVALFRVNATPVEAADESYLTVTYLDKSCLTSYSTNLDGGIIKIAYFQYDETRKGYYMYDNWDKVGTLSDIKDTDDMSVYSSHLLTVEKDRQYHYPENVKTKVIAYLYDGADTYTNKKTFLEMTTVPPEGGIDQCTFQYTTPSKLIEGSVNPYQELKVYVDAILKETTLTTNSIARYTVVGPNNYSYSSVYLDYKKYTSESTPLADRKNFFTITGGGLYKVTFYTTGNKEYTVEKEIQSDIFVVPVVNESDTIYPTIGYTFSKDTATKGEDVTLSVSTSELCTITVNGIAYTNTQTADIIFKDNTDFIIKASDSVGNITTLGVKYTTFTDVNESSYIESERNSSWSENVSKGLLPQTGGADFVIYILFGVILICSGIIFIYGTYKNKNKTKTKDINDTEK